MSAAIDEIREIKRAWLRAVLVGIGICGLVGPMLPLLVTFPIAIFNERPLGRSTLSSLGIFPIAWLAAVFVVGPAGAVLGALGALWIRFRSRNIGFKQLLFETALAGLGFGTLAPLPLLALGTNHSDLSSFKGYILMGCASGIVCALLVLLTMNQFALLARKPNSN